MKKYEKPRVIIERFTLAEHIASCAFDKDGDVFVGSSDLGADGVILFNDANITCNMTKEDALGAFEGYCDTNGGNGVNLLYNS